MRDLDDLFGALARSEFRSRFRLGPGEKEYLARKGLQTILAEAAKFITDRLAPAMPARDGSQTPMRNHPAFIAQHATATCCRKCLEKWHRIPRGRELTADQIDYIVSVLTRWIGQNAK